MDCGMACKTVVGLFIFLVFSLGCLTSIKATEPDFDPILDAPPSVPQPRLYVQSRASSLLVKTDIGTYFGVSSSYKASDLSTLYGGTRPRFAFNLGARLSIPVELTLGVILGFGETYENREFDHALDVFTKFETSYIPFSYEGWGLGASAGLILATYDVEDGTLSQLAYGPLLAAKLSKDLSANNQVYLDFSWSPIYNTTAFYLRDPTPEELEENPEAYKFKVKGEWGHLFMLSIGISLFGF